MVIVFTSNKELTSLLINLETEIIVIAISETWLKSSHIYFNIQNYYMEHELLPKKHAGGVALYLHNVLQYKVCNDLRIVIQNLLILYLLKLIIHVLVQHIILLLVVYIDHHGLICHNLMSYCTKPWTY